MLFEFFLNSHSLFFLKNKSQLPYCLSKTFFFRMDEGTSHKRLHRVTGLFQRGGQKVECCSKSTMCKQSEQTQILSPANTCCRLNMGEGGHPGGRSQAAERARARGRSSPRRSRPGLRASARAPAGPERRERPGTREEMEGEALFRGRERCAASYALGGESREGKVLRDGEEKGRITSWVRRADLGRTDLAKHP